MFSADSTVLAYILKKLNQEYNYGLKLILLSVDEGITGYRDDSLEVRTYKTLKGMELDRVIFVQRGQLGFDKYFYYTII